MCDSSLPLANHLDFESGGMRAISIAHCAVFSDEIILQILSLLLTSEHVKCSRISVSQMSRKETPLATAPFSARTRTIGIGEGSKVLTRVASPLCSSGQRTDDRRLRRRDGGACND